MAASLLACPICSQPGFSSVDSLRHGLISAATRHLTCPVCQDVLLGLDKFTIHLFSHSLQHAYAKSSEFQHCGTRSTSTDHVSRFIQDSIEAVASSSQLSTQNKHRDRDHNGILKVEGVKNGGRGDVVSSWSCEKKVKTRPLVQSSNSGGSKQDGDSPLNLCNNAVAAASPAEVTTCEFCRFSFPDPTILEIHRQLVHQNGDTFKSTSASRTDDRRQFSCYVCQKAFKMRGSLMVHMRVAHGGITPGKSVQPTVEAEQQHQQVEEIRSFPCTTCGKAFKKEQHLSQHIKTHEGKQWECDVCSKMFTTKYFLKKHKRLHTGEMPYSCSTCNKTFTFQQSYHKHLLYHSDDKPHVCTECDRAFKELSTLHNHQRIHTGEKPFACETCELSNRVVQCVSANPA